MKLEKIVVIGPVYPYKGGISHYTGLMVRTLKTKYDTTVISYKMQYPKIMFRKPQKDYTNKAFEIPGTRYLINTANPFNILGCVKKIKALNPDLIIIQWWHPYFAPCYNILLGGLKKYKTIMICHNVLPHERFPLDRFLTKCTLGKVGGCIVHSEEDKNNLLNLFPNKPYRKNVHPTYNAFKMKDMSRAKARELLNISKDEKILLFFGFVRKYKGLKHLLNAMPDILNDNRDVRLFIVGDFGKDKDEYLQQINELSLGDHIVIKDGYTPDEEVEKYFACADICMCPYESATQSGIVQIAFGFGLPVLVTDVGGLPEVVDDKKTGYVVEPEKPDAIASAVKDYFGNNREESFRENVDKEKMRFSWERMMETIEELSNEIDGR